MFYSVILLSQAPLARRSRALPSVLYLRVSTKASFNYICCLSGLISLDTYYLYDFGIGISVKATEERNIYNFSPKAYLSQNVYVLSYSNKGNNKPYALVKLLSNWIN